MGTARYLARRQRRTSRARSAPAREALDGTQVDAAVDGLVEPAGRARAALDRHALSARAFSPTALQNFAACPYRFLLHAMHQPRRRARAPRPSRRSTPLQSGSLVHEALYRAARVACATRGSCPSPEPRSRPRAPGSTRSSNRGRGSRSTSELAPAIERVWEDGIACVRADLPRVAPPRRARVRAGCRARFELSFGLPALRARDR